jgi:hypothetical protein
MRLTTDGPPYDVLCQTGGYELNEVVGDQKGRPGGDVAICSGWINQGADTVHMTVKYQKLW